MKPIVLSRHASEQAAERGTSSDQIQETIREAGWQLARSGRYECRKDFMFESVWLGKPYATKQVRPVFVEEDERIVVVTVYVYYF